MVWPDTHDSVRTVHSAMGRAVAGTASLKKVPGARVRVPLPRQAPAVHGVMVTVAVLEEVVVVDVTMLPPEHCETGAERC